LYDMPEIISLSVRPFASQRVLNREKLGGFWWYLACNICHWTVYQIVFPRFPTVDNTNVVNPRTFELGATLALLNRVLKRYKFILAYLLKYTFVTSVDLSTNTCWRLGQDSITR
jgi:hypothetical protein